MIETKRKRFKRKIEIFLKIKGVSVKANILKISEDGKTVQNWQKHGIEPLLIPSELNEK